MAEEPTPPPEDGGDDETIGDDDVNIPPEIPFLDVQAGADGIVRVSAGVADTETGEPRTMVVNYVGGAMSQAVGPTIEGAIEWYRDAFVALLKVAEEDDGGSP